MINQKTMLEVEIADKKYQLLCDVDSPLGSLHDALMQMKGFCVERMLGAQKEEEEIARKLMSNPESCNTCE